MLTRIGRAYEDAFLDESPSVLQGRADKLIGAMRGFEPGASGAFPSRWAKHSPAKHALAAKGFDPENTPPGFFDLAAVLAGRKPVAGLYTADLSAPLGAELRRRARAAGLWELHYPSEREVNRWVDIGDLTSLQELARALGSTESRRIVARDIGRAYGYPEAQIAEHCAFELDVPWTPLKGLRWEGP